MDEEPERENRERRTAIRIKSFQVAGEHDASARKTRHYSEVKSEEGSKNQVLFLFLPYRAAEAGQFFDQLFIASLQMIDAGNFRAAGRGKTSDNK